MAEMMAEIMSWLKWIGSWPWELRTLLFVACSIVGFLLAYATPHIPKLEREAEKARQPAPSQSVPVIVQPINIGDTKVEISPATIEQSSPKQEPNSIAQQAPRPFKVERPQQQTPKQTPAPIGVRGSKNEAEHSSGREDRSRKIGSAGSITKYYSSKKYLRGNVTIQVTGGSAIIQLAGDYVPDYERDYKLKSLTTGDEIDIKVFMLLTR